MNEQTQDQLQGKRTMQKLMGSNLHHVFAVRHKKSFKYLARYGFAEADREVKFWDRIGPARARITSDRVNIENYEVVEFEVFEFATHPAKRKSRKTQ